jgi:ribosome assembly protein RRB1
MPKRTSEAAELPSGKAAALGQATARPEAALVEEDEGMGEFEDRWEDEVESDGEVIDANAGGDEDGEDGEDGGCLTS